jgi:hypothetical protein
MPLVVFKRRWHRDDAGSCKTRVCKTCLAGNQSAPLRFISHSRESVRTSTFASLRRSEFDKAVTFSLPRHDNP